MLRFKGLPVHLFLVVIGMLTLANTVSAKDLIRSVEGTVIKVSDGDTVQVVTHEGTKLKVRLAGVDCPETPKINHKTGKVNKPGQPYGEEAQAFVERMVSGKTVKVDIYGIDQYQRVLAYVFSDGRNMNLELVRAGLAEVYKGGEYGPFKRELIEAEREARGARRGMWVLGNQYESPREFRKRLRVRGE